MYLQIASAATGGVSKQEPATRQSNDGQSVQNERVCKMRKIHIFEQIMKRERQQPRRRVLELEYKNRVRVET
jgi:hypothetical protein